MGQNTLSLPKARLNGSGVVRKPDGQIRQDEIYEELKKEDNDGLADPTTGKYIGPDAGKAP